MVPRVDFVLHGVSPAGVARPQLECPFVLPQQFLQGWLLIGFHPLRQDRHYPVRLFPGGLSSRLPFADHTASGSVSRGIRGLGAYDRFQ